MTARLLISVSLVLALAGCESKLNPFNWFPGSSSDGVALTPEGGYAADNEYRDLVAEVTELSIDRTAGGAILQATGMPPRLGYWNAELVPENDGKPVDGVLTFSFRVAAPLTATAESTPYARNIVVATFLSDQKLAGVRSIVVLGETNSRSLRR